MARLVLTDQATRGVVLVDLPGPSFMSVTPPGSVELCGVCMLDDGRVAVTDRGAGVVRVGEPVSGGWVDGPPPSEAELDRPTSVSVSVSGGLLVVDSGHRRLLWCDSWVTVVSEIAIGTLRAPLSATDTGNGDVWVTDQAQGLLLSIDNGPLQPVSLPAVTSPTGHRPSLLVHVSRGLDGGVVVTDLPAARVLLVGPAGDVTTVVDGGGSEPNAVRAPLAAVTDGDEFDPSVYVLDAGTNRILAFQQNGAGGWEPVDEVRGESADGTRHFTRPVSMALEGGA